MSEPRENKSACDQESAKNQGRSTAQEQGPGETERWVLDALEDDEVREILKQNRAHDCAK